MSAGAPDVTVSLVNTDNRELLLACLRSLPAAAGDATLQVVVVDNASRDGSADAVAAAHPDVELVRRGRRHGFAANHNRAIARARGRHVLVLNEDTVLDPDAIGRLARFLDRRPAAGAAGPRLVYPDGSPQPSAWHFPTPARVALTTATLQRRGWVQSHGDRPRPVDWLCGAAVLVRAEPLRQLGGLDERSFIYSEDVDLCLRLARAGWERWFVPAARLVHYENATTTGVPERRIYQMARGRAAYARKHHGRAGELAIRGLTAATFGARAAVAGASLLLPAAVPGRRFSRDDARRFLAHARAQIDPYGRPAIEDAAAEDDAARAAAAPPAA